ncbi:MAG TPA: hypothetical protein VIU33_03420, partial [Nitrospiria bacterium]
LYHQAGLYEKEGDIKGAVDCLTQVVAIDEKYGLPKLSENRNRLANLRSKAGSGIKKPGKPPRGGKNRGQQ